MILILLFISLAHCLASCPSKEEKDDALCIEGGCPWYTNCYSIESDLVCCYSYMDNILYKSCNNSEPLLKLITFTFWIKLTLIILICIRHLIRKF